MYEITYSRIALKKLSKLEKPLKERILNSLERIRIRPESYIKKLVGNSYYSLRVGDYRIILNLTKNQLKILVLTLGHRKKAYK
tara:strand:+ start:687 stop:935 length:249 start_codon:yes stop_codon:yes gene_type:complete